jgi:hypothetical protein
MPGPGTGPRPGGWETLMYMTWVGFTGRLTAVWLCHGIERLFYLSNRFSKLRRSVWSRIEYTHDFRSLEHFDSRTGHGYVRPMLFSVTLEQVLCFCEHVNEHTVSIHCDKLVGLMRVYYFIKKWLLQLGWPLDIFDGPTPDPLSSTKRHCPKPVLRSSFWIRKR